MADAAQTMDAETLDDFPWRMLRPCLLPSLIVWMVLPDVALPGRKTPKRGWIGVPLAIMGAALAIAGFYVIFWGGAFGAYGFTASLLAGQPYHWFPQPEGWHKIWAVLVGGVVGFSSMAGTQATVGAFAPRGPWWLVYQLESACIAILEAPFRALKFVIHRGRGHLAPSVKNHELTSVQVSLRPQPNVRPRQSTLAKFTNPGSPVIDAQFRVVGSLCDRISELNRQGYFQSTTFGVLASYGLETIMRLSIAVAVVIIGAFVLGPAYWVAPRYGLIAAWVLGIVLAFVALFIGGIVYEGIEALKWRRESGRRERKRRGLPIEESLCDACERWVRDKFGAWWAKL